MFTRWQFQIVLIAFPIVLAALAGAFLDQPVAYAQGEDVGYVDVGIFLEVPDDVQAIGSHELNIIVVNRGPRAAYDVVVVVDVVSPDKSRMGSLGLPPKVPLGSASLDGTALRWTIPELGRLQREEVTAQVTHRVTSPPSAAFDNTAYPHEFFGAVATASYDNNLRNNTARVWSYDYSATAGGNDTTRQVLGNYSVSVSVDNPNPSPGDTVNFTITATRDNAYGGGVNTVGTAPPIDLKVDIELTGGLSVSGDPSYAPATGRADSVNYSNGVFTIGTVKQALSRENSVTLPVSVSSSAVVNKQCLTATLTGNPPPGVGPYDDDVLDNVDKVCLGEPPDQTVVFTSGETDLLKLHPCVGNTAYPCTDAGGVVLAVNGGTAGAHVEGYDNAVFEPENIIVQIKDPAGRNVSGTNLRWRTGFSIGMHLPGTDTGYSNLTFAIQSSSDSDSTLPNNPGSIWFYIPGPTLWLSTDPSENKLSNSHAGIASTSSFDSYFEFDKLGTYRADITLGATNSGTAYTSNATYTFHVGPILDLSVAGGDNNAAAAGRTAFTIRAANNGPENSADATVKLELPQGALVEDYVASEGSYANGQWNLPRLGMRDYRRSQGKPEEASLTLNLKEGGGIPQEPATATISLTDNSYTVCIGSDRSTLEHDNQADCKSDAATTDVWYAAVCVQDSDQTVNTTTTHDTQTKCAGQTGHTWTANVCASSDGGVRAGRTETECDGWFEGTVYDYNAANNTAKIAAVEGTGIGPDIPASVTTQTGTTTTVMWEDVEYLYGVPVARYEVQWLGGDWTTLGHAEIANEYWDAAPTGRRAYRVRAVNAAGVAGPWSRSSVQVPVGSAGSPLNLRTQADGNNAIDVFWDSPEDIGGSPITGYRVEWTADPEEGRWGSGANTSELTYKHRGLQTGATWYYRVAARNSGGLGLWSDPAQGKTASGAPDAPTLQAKTLSDYEIELTWNEPKDNGEPITGYQLERSRDGSADSWSQLATPGAGATTYTDSTLSANTRYSYRVRAVNSVGDGAWSRSVSAMTQLTPPDAPYLTSVEADGPNAIVLTWEEPFQLGDLPVTQYQVQWAKDDSSEIWRGPQTLSGSTRSWRHTGLKPGETWHYQVRASNGGGRWSVWSYSLAATTASEKVPTAAPSGLTATYEPAPDDNGVSSVTLKWNAPSGSATITGYDLQYSEDNSQWEKVTDDPVDALTYTDDGYHLYPGAQIHYRVRARSAEGAGPWSRSVRVSVPADSPDAPRIMWVEADGSNHIYLEWEPPYYDGGAAITGYGLLWCRALDGADENPCEVDENNSPADPPGYSRISLGASQRSYTHSVSPGYNYYYLLRATNGGNRWSEWEEYDFNYARTYAGVPAAPGLRAQSVDANQIKLTWSRPSSSGSEIRNYWLYVYENGEDLHDWDNILDIVTVPGDRTEWTIGELSPGTTRYFRIRALNDNGEGKYSALRQATTPSN